MTPFRPTRLSFRASRLAPLLAGALLCASGLALAQTPPAFRCGGIGSDESTAMRAEMKNHPLSLLFARTDGAYLADVDVTVSGAAKLEFRAAGPLCLINVPTGAYTVEARADGAVQRQQVTVGGGAKTASFRF